LKGQVHYSVEKNVAILTVDNPPVNPLSEGIRNGLYDLIIKANGDPGVEGIIITGNGRAFIAGADISEFGGEPKGRSLHEAFDKIENSSKPVVAAINGLALGGGLETALCCNYRIASKYAVLGLPEVNLGLLPGAGGTQRLPRLIGSSEALKMMISGKHISSNKALKLGIIDAISENLIDEAINLINNKKDIKKHPKIRDINTKIIDDRSKPNIIAEARAFAAKIRKGQFAPSKIIQCVEEAINNDSFDDGIKKESEYFLECLFHPQREAMIHIFFGERAAAKIDDMPQNQKITDIKKVGVIGSGTMGGGIAMCFANVGIPVHILDQDEKNLNNGISVIKKNYEFMINKGRISTDQGEIVNKLITSSINYEDVKDCDLVIEAVYENLDLKKQIFTKLDAIVKPSSILATNTSGLDIDAIASSTKRPEKIVGTHFFSPANVMRLLEIVRGKETSYETLATILSVGKKLKKAPVVSLNAPGFIGNRMLFGYTAQANKLLLEGALPNQVDNALENFGMNMGPFRMMDLVGLDLGWRARKMSGKESPNTAKIADSLCELGRFGQKTNKGYYNYNEGSRSPSPAPENELIYSQVRKDIGKVEREISDEEIVDRCILALINEGAKILHEGVAQRSVDIDIVYISGYGFPIWEGGPMHYANSRGLDNILEKLNKYHKQTADEVFNPSNLLVEAANNHHKLGNAPEKDKRKEILGFEKASIANNY
jgi:3-hydroxyacyl-CoA dehydrogenase